MIILQSKCVTVAVVHQHEWNDVVAVVNVAAVHASHQYLPIFTDINVKLHCGNKISNFSSYTALKTEFGRLVIESLVKEF